MVRSFDRVLVVDEICAAFGQLSTLNLLPQLRQAGEGCFPELVRVTLFGRASVLASRFVRSLATLECATACFPLTLPDRSIAIALEILFTFA